MFGDRFPIHAFSAATGAGLEPTNDPVPLAQRHWLRKAPGQPADMAALRSADRQHVQEFAGRVHHDFVEGLKSAKIWGTGVFDGQSVGREHVLHDKDVVELHL